MLDASVAKLNRRGFIGALAGLTAMVKLPTDWRYTSFVPTESFRVDFVHHGMAADSLEDAELWLKKEYPNREFYSVMGQFVYPIGTDQDEIASGNESCALVLAESWRDDLSFRKFPMNPCRIVYLPCRSEGKSAYA